MMLMGCRLNGNLRSSRRARLHPVLGVGEKFEQKFRRHGHEVD